MSFDFWSWTGPQITLVKVSRIIFGPEPKGTQTMGLKLPPSAYGPPIMSLGAGLFRIRAMIGRSPIMSFDFGGLKM